MKLCEVFEDDDVDRLTVKFEEWIDSGVAFGEIRVIDNTDKDIGIRMERWEGNEELEFVYDSRENESGPYRDSEVITVFEDEPNGTRVLWDSVNGAVKVDTEGEWLLPEISLLRGSIIA